MRERRTLPHVASRTVVYSQPGKSENVQVEVVTFVPLLVGPVAVLVVHATEPVAVFLATVEVTIEWALNLWYDTLLAWVAIPAVVKLFVVGT